MVETPDPTADPHGPAPLSPSHPAHTRSAQMTSADTRTYMALVAVAQHHGRPHTPTEQAWIESFFGHIKTEWPHLETITDPAILDAELTRIRTIYNTVRLPLGHVDH